jgi:hypothetical protein
VEAQATRAAAAPATILLVYVLAMSLLIAEPCFGKEISELVREMSL